MAEYLKEALQGKTLGWAPAQRVPGTGRTPVMLEGEVRGWPVEQSGEESAQGAPVALIWSEMETARRL